jgi:transposase
MAEEYNADQLIFIDESAKDERTTARRYGWAPRNQRATIRHPFVRGRRYTILPALSLDGIITTRIIDGSCTKELFEEFIVEDVIPHMEKFPAQRSVLVMDNARIHHHAELIEWLEENGYMVEFLPPYSPDFNPIEEAFSAIKAWIRRHAKDYEHIDDAHVLLEDACSRIDYQHAIRYFRDCGYL